MIFVKKILINAANLHNGGAIQVAVSFLHELFKASDFFNEYNVTIFASSEVDVDLRNLGLDVDQFSNYMIVDVYGLEALKGKVARKFYGYDLVFTIFGPLYLPIRVPNQIVGFAQPWILYPDNEISRSEKFFYYLKNRLKFSIQWFFFRFSATCLIVELPHVKRRLVTFKRYSQEKIYVVRNCISPVYLDRTKWLPLSKPLKVEKEVIKIGYVSRAYPHKNLLILLDVAKQLMDQPRRVEFFVTLKDEEWENFSLEYRSVIKNVGPLKISQCPSFYQAMDGVIFTSLLECFSATPIEAMMMHLPLFASDRGFVRDVCAGHAVYIDPEDSRDIAVKIKKWFFEKKIEEKIFHLENAYAYALKMPSNKDRADDYVNIIREMLRK